MTSTKRRKAKPKKAEGIAVIARNRGNRSRSDVSSWIAALFRALIYPRLQLPSFAFPITGDHVAIPAIPRDLPFCSPRLLKSLHA